MNFIKKSFAEEIEESFVKSLEAPEVNYDALKVKEVIANLHAAANLLDQAEMEKEADVITALLISLAEDSATSGLTSEKMLKNLEEKGWVFNADDQDLQEVDSFLTDQIDPPEKEIVVEIEEEPIKTALWWSLHKKR